MRTSHYCVSSVFCGALALGCASEGSGYSTESSTTSSTSGQQSGAMTTGESVPTMAIATSTATTTSATSTDSGSTGEACTFLNCDDMLRDECDVFAQDCPEGQKCAAWADDGSNAWNAVKCVDVTGTDKPGEPCTSDVRSLSGIDSCIEGAICWNRNEEGVGTCLALCTGSPEAPVCPDGACSTSGSGVLNLCLSYCDPLLQDCPGAGLCLPSGDSFVCILDASGDEGQANDSCEYTNVCDPGLVCLDPATAGAGCEPAAGGCCTPFCKFPDGACPNPDQSCVQWFDPAMLPENDPDLDIGFCGVPD